jgi:hypothetical protein
MRSTSFSAKRSCILGFLVVASALAPAACLAQEVSIRSESDYEKHGFPTLARFWTEKESFAALAAAEKLAKIDPKYLPTWGHPVSRNVFSRLTNPRHLETSGPTGEKYFAALEKLYLKYGKADATRFDIDFPEIQKGRLHFAETRLGKIRQTERGAIADEVFAALMSWARVRFDLKNEYSEAFHLKM